METAEKTIESTKERGAVSMSPSTSLLDSIMDAVRNTPQKLHEYMCHGDYHGYHAPDYETIRAKIEALLSNASGESRAIARTLDPVVGDFE